MLKLDKPFLSFSNWGPSYINPPKLPIMDLATFYAEDVWGLLLFEWPPLGQFSQPYLLLVRCVNFKAVFV